MRVGDRTGVEPFYMNGLHKRVKNHKRLRLGCCELETASILKTCKLSIDEDDEKRRQAKIAMVQDHTRSMLPLMLGLQSHHSTLVR
jgi:hypothetical protein